MAFVLLLAQTLLVSARADNIDCPVLSEQAVDLEDVYDRYNVTKEVLKAVPDTFLAVR